MRSDSMGEIYINSLSRKWARGLLNFVANQVEF
jgi:hypothetical protein